MGLFFKKSFRGDLAIICAIMGAFIVMAILYATEVMEAFGFKDPPNFSTLIVEIGVGITIAYIVYLISTKQQEKMKEITGDIKKILDEQQSLKEKRKEYVEQTIGIEVYLTLDEFKNLQNRLKFIQEKESSGKTFLGVIQNYHARLSYRWKWNVIENIDIYSENLDPVIIDRCRSIELYIRELTSEFNKLDNYKGLRGCIDMAVMDLDILSKILPMPKF